MFNIKIKSKNFQKGQEGAELLSLTISEEKINKLKFI